MKRTILPSLVGVILGFAVAAGVGSCQGDRPASVPQFTASATHAEPRSGKWPAVRREHLAKHPSCEACGGTKDLQVHHRRPFHLHPELELDPDNLITLCEHSGRDCHLRYGHDLDFKKENLNVVEDAAKELKRLNR